MKCELMFVKVLIIHEFEMESVYQSAGELAAKLKLDFLAAWTFLGRLKSDTNHTWCESCDSFCCLDEMTVSTILLYRRLIKPAIQTRNRTNG